VAMKKALENFDDGHQQLKWPFTRAS